MIRVSKLLLLLTAALLLAACGGDDSSSKDSKSSKSKEKKIDRTGYFTDKESGTLNPALATWNEAVADGNKNAKACDDEAQRKYKQGKSPRESVQCHLRETKAMLTAIAGVRQATIDVQDGDWRAECDAGIKDFLAFLDTHESAWKTLQADWEYYASGKGQPKQFDKHATATSVSNDTFSQKQIPAFAQACYTQADISDAAKAASKDEASKDDTSSDKS